MPCRYSHPGHTGGSGKAFFFLVGGEGGETDNELFNLEQLSKMQPNRHMSGIVSCLATLWFALHEILRTI